jgi:hypothetical protein
MAMPLNSSFQGLFYLPLDELNRFTTSILSKYMTTPPLENKQNNSEIPEFSQHWAAPAWTHHTALRVSKTCKTPLVPSTTQASQLSGQIHALTLT